MLKSLLRNKTRGNRVAFWLKQKGKKSSVSWDRAYRMNMLSGQLGGEVNWLSNSPQQLFAKAFSSTQGAI